MTHTVQRSALVPYSADKMYQLVADIPRYPEFLKWCSGADVLRDDGEEVIASISINFKGLNKSFSTRNRMQPCSAIEMSLVEGLFSYFKGTWRFIPLEQDASKIELDMSFGFDNVVVQKLVGPIFSFIANQQVDAFQQRARDIYGG